MRVTNSELQTFKRCRRKWWLAYYRHLTLRREEVTGPRAIGTRVHLALAAYYSTERANPLEVLKATVEEDLPKAQAVGVTEKFAQDCELAAIMLEGYLEWVQVTGADQGLSVVAAETPIEVATTVPGVTLMGKLDVRVYREWDRARLFMDHKTVGSLEHPTLHMDEQLLMYHLLERLDMLEHGVEGERTVGGVWNMLRKVKRTKASKPPYYGRIEVRHNDAELRNFYTRVHGVIHEIVRLRDALAAGQPHQFTAYPSPRSTCAWDCDFFSVCHMFDDDSRAEDMLAANYQQYDPYARYGRDDETEDT